MARLPKTHDEDVGFLEDFKCDLGFVLTMIESTQPRQAEAAIVEMADIVRRRLETLSSRPEPELLAVVESAVALVMVERMLIVWKQRIGEFTDPVIDDALRFATETIDNLDPIASRGGCMALRDQVSIAMQIVPRKFGDFFQL